MSLSAKQKVAVGLLLEQTQQSLGAFILLTQLMMQQLTTQLIMTIPQLKVIMELVWLQHPAK